MTLDAEDLTVGQVVATAGAVGLLVVEIDATLGALAQWLQVLPRHSHLPSARFIAALTTILVIFS